MNAIERDENSAEFFDAALRGELAVQHCASCDHWQFPQPFNSATSRCRHCGAVRLTWRPASGAAQLVSRTVLYRKPRPDGTPAPTTTIGIVELAEGAWVHTQLRVDAGQLRAGLPLRVAFERPDGGEAIPVFELAS